MPDVAVVLALVLSSGSLVVSIASFVLAISAKWQAKKAATLGFRIEAINHLRAMLSDIDRGVSQAERLTRSTTRCAPPNSFSAAMSERDFCSDPEGSTPSR
jgi:hypothetical protein